MYCQSQLKDVVTTGGPYRSWNWSLHRSSRKDRLLQATDHLGPGFTDHSGNISLVPRPLRTVMLVPFWRERPMPVISTYKSIYKKKYIYIGTITFIILINPQEDLSIGARDFILFNYLSLPSHDTPCDNEWGTKGYGGEDLEVMWGHLGWHTNMLDRRAYATPIFERWRRVHAM